MDNSNEEEELSPEQLHSAMKTALDRLIGEECLDIRAGRGTGSMVLLEFGWKIPCERPLKTSHISADYQKGEGEFKVFVNQCVWRVDSEKEVICVCGDSNLPDGPMIRGLNLLSGQRLASYELSFPGFDLALHFNNGLTLRLFCSQLNAEQQGNYHLTLPELHYIIGPRSQPGIEFRKKCKLY